MNQTQASWVKRSKLLLGVMGLCIMTGAAFCGQRTDANPQMLIQQQACVQNIQQGDFERAETRCEICLEYDERNPECLNGMGLVWYARGVDEKADEFFFTTLFSQHNV